MSLVERTGSWRSGAAALEAAAELALTLGHHERAVEFHGARERIARGLGEDPRTREERSELLRRLRGQLGGERFDAAWAASRATPLPFEYYVSVARHWLESLDPELVSQAAPGGSPHSAVPARDPGMEDTTVELVVQANCGSPAAKDLLARRHLGALRRFAHGRLPSRARGLMDTNDLVQVALIRALERLRALRPNKKGDFLAYLRRIVINRVRDEIRRSSRALASVPLEDLPSPAPSPLDDAIEGEMLASYRAALSGLSSRQRRALLLRLDHGLSYQELADRIGSPSSNAARMVVSRALVLVAKSLGRSKGGRAVPARRSKDGPAAL